MKWVKVLKAEKGKSKMTIMDFCKKWELTKEHGSWLMEYLNCDDWDTTEFEESEIMNALNKFKDEHWDIYTNAYED